MSSINPFDPSPVYDHIISSYNKTIIDPDILKTIKDYISKQSISIDEDSALNAIIYGIECKQHIHNKERHVVIFQQNSKQFILSIARKSKERVEEFDLSQVTHISFDRNPNAKEKIVQLLTKKFSWVFQFYSDADMVSFLGGILQLYKIYEKYDSNSIMHHIKQIWSYYDRNFSKTMEKDEFKEFTQDVNMAFNHNFDFNETFDRIDQNNNGLIDFNEFVHFYKSYMDGHEYKEIFDKYLKKNNGNSISNITPMSSGIDDDEEDDEPLMSAGQLRKFFQEEQKETFSLWDVYKIIVLHKQGLNKETKTYLIDKIDKAIQLSKEERGNLYMTLQEFKLMLHSSVTDVLDYKQINEGQDMNRPLNDYYINSTHNTYLTGHQLTSESSVDMYSYAVLEGYRLVELDCYNGSGDNIIITHGYTLTSSLHLKDVLIQLKKNSFISSSYPVILSIENHLDKEHQDIMAKLFQDILIDLYIFPQNCPPDYLPPIKEMKNKFIVKCSGKRIQKDRNNIIPRKLLTYTTERDTFNDKQINALKSRDISEISINFQSIIQREKLKSFRKATLLEIDMEKIKKLKENEEIVSELAKCRGLFGAKFKLELLQENNYQPWEMVSLKYTKLNEFAADYNKRRIIIDFTQNTLMKAYPTGFDSSNFDPIKSWIVGCNIVAFNIQTTEDDWTLLNMVFFTNNRNRGYVLKPPKLLPESTFIETYEKPYEKITIRIINMIGLGKLFSNEGVAFEQKSMIKLKCWMVGSNVDDKNNKSFTGRINGDFLMPKITTDDIISFDIYEKDLSSIFFRLTYDKSIIGRSVIPLMLMKEGVRKIYIYDSNCLKYKESFLVALIKRTAYDS